MGGIALSEKKFILCNMFQLHSRNLHFTFCLFTEKENDLLKHLLSCIYVEGPSSLTAGSWGIWKINYVVVLLLQWFRDVVRGVEMFENYWSKSCCLNGASSSNSTSQRI